MLSEERSRTFALALLADGTVIAGVTPEDHTAAMLVQSTGSIPTFVRVCVCQSFTQSKLRANCQGLKAAEFLLTTLQIYS